MRVALLGIVAGWSGSAVAAPQSLNVIPTSISLRPGDHAAVLKVVNKGESESLIQVRVFAWSQEEHGQDRLVPTDLIAVSPPIATVPPAGVQVIRLMLRQAPGARESTYRILVDQIPSVNQTGQVRVALRLSLPVFAPPQARCSALLRYNVERVGGSLVLVATNTGNCHEVLNNIKVTTSSGETLSPGTGASPYVLAGSTQRWRLAAGSALPGAGQTIRLVAIARQEGAVDQYLTAE